MVVCLSVWTEGLSSTVEGGQWWQSMALGVRGQGLLTAVCGGRVGAMCV